MGPIARSALLALSPDNGSSRGESDAAADATTTKVAASTTRGSCAEVACEGTRTGGRTDVCLVTKARGALSVVRNGGESLSAERTNWSTNVGSPSTNSARRSWR